MTGIPYIPEYIVVHLGKPDEQAENVTVSFIDYIKNVASSEIYPTWPEESIKANIYAQISYALNRVYTEWYRSKGYDFDITSSTQFDQKFINNRNIYDTINRVVDELFNDYLRKVGTVNPYFTQYCNGTTSKCDGLSQWGTVPLAQEGRNAMQIIRYYYGNDTELVVDAKVGENVPSYPGTPIKLGDFGEDVRRMQIYLNRISRNYPSIPKIPVTDGAFGKSTEDAVKMFQKQFKLTVDGIIGKGTWYRIIYIYTSVKKLSELVSEGIGYSDLPHQFNTAIKKGQSGGQVLTLQYFLSFVAEFDDNIPAVTMDGIFGEDTENSVKAFQRTRGLTADGIVGENTWHTLYDAYKGIIDFIAEEEPQDIAPYPNVVLERGMAGPSIMIIYPDFYTKFLPFQLMEISAQKHRRRWSIFKRYFNCLKPEK